MTIDKNIYVITISKANFGVWKMKTKEKFIIGQVEGRPSMKSIGTPKNQKGDFYICNKMNIGNPIKLMCRFIL